MKWVHKDTRTMSTDFITDFLHAQHINIVFLSSRHLKPIFHFNIPWIRQSTCYFLTFLGGAEMKHLFKMG